MIIVQWKVSCMAGVAIIPAVFQRLSFNGKWSDEARRAIRPTTWFSREFVGLVGLIVLLDMGYQHNSLGLRGKVGDLVFVKDGTVRRRRASNKEEFDSSERMVRVRENAQEFGTASTASKLLRQALHGLIGTAKDRFMASRLTQRMAAIIKADTEGARGARQVRKAAAIAQLPGFNFNQAALAAGWHAAYTVEQDGASVRLRVPRLRPAQDLAAPVGATHYELVFGAAALDFGAEHMLATGPASGGGKQALQDAAGLELAVSFAAELGSSFVTVAVLGVRFYQYVGETYCPLQGAAGDALAVVFVG